MNIIIRKMEERDVPRVKEIEDLSFSSPWTLDAFYKEARENNLAYYLVAEVDGVVADRKIAGYFGSWLVLTEAHITNIAVHPDFRKKKIGTMLTEYFINHLKELGIEYATLEVRISNTAAKNLYEKFGFEVKGVRKKYYDNNEDAYLMVLELGNRE